MGTICLLVFEGTSTRCTPPLAQMHTLDTYRMKSNAAGGADVVVRGQETVRMDRHQHLEPSIFRRRDKEVQRRLEKPRTLADHRLQIFAPTQQEEAHPREITSE